MVLRLVFFHILSWICLRISIINTNQIRRRCSVKERRILLVIVIITFTAVIFVVVTAVVDVVILLFVFVKKLYCSVCVADQVICLFLTRNSKEITSVITKIAVKL